MLLTRGQDERVEIGRYGTGFTYSFGSDWIDTIAEKIGAYGADKFIVVTDDKVRSLHGDKRIPALLRMANVLVLSSPPGESMKTVTRLDAYLSRAIEAGCTRRSIVVAFGGGVPGNLGGMVAALLFRGLRLIHVSTTTMAAMDSVLSAKQAVNSAAGKNHVGVFHTPFAAFVDVDLLKTLPARELRSGLCETIKNCLALRPQALPDLERILRKDDLTSSETLLWMLRESIAVKSTLLASDPHEREAGIILEYGHTVGHAVEFCDHQVRGAHAVTHGEAVGLGMMVAARVSSALGLLGNEAVHTHNCILSLANVALQLPIGIGPGDVIDTLRKDNKRGYLELSPDQVAMVLLREIGRPAGAVEMPLVPVPLSLIEQILADFAVPTSQTSRPSVQA